MPPNPPTPHGKALGLKKNGWHVDEVTEPAGMPATPIVKVKGVTLPVSRYTRSGGKITLLDEISVHATLEVYDGVSLVWRWSAARGDLVGGP